MEIRHAEITSIGGGYAPNLFNEGLALVMDNIADERTDAKKTRKVVLEFQFKPDAMRFSTEVEIKMKTDLAPRDSKKAMVYLSQDAEGENRMTISDPAQAELAFGLAGGLAAAAVGEVKK